ncbi:hypothetical protein NGRA_3578, partial [Nosema granulosis]
LRMQDTPNKHFDMATATKTITPFEGGDNEDIDTWIRDLLLVAEVAEWSERDTCRVAVMCLKGKARSWASQILIGKMEALDIKTLSALLKRRFTSESNKQVALTKFISMEVPKSREEFSEMLRLATSIHERKIVALEVIAQMVVEKTPGEIRAYLYQKGLSISSWEEFVQAAEEMICMAFPERMVARLRNEGMQQGGQPKGRIVREYPKWD